MMLAICAWCKTELGYRTGPEGEITHGCCAACKDKQLASMRNTFVWVPGMIGLVALLLLFGWVGERDLQDKLAAATYTVGPSAQELAAVGLDGPVSLAQVGSQPQHGVHAAETQSVGVASVAGFDRRVSPSWPSGPFSREVGR